MSLTIRRLASLLLLAAVAALTAGACVVDEPAAADCRAPIDLYLDATEVAGPTGAMTQILVPGDDPVTVDGGVCACTTDACRGAFIAETVGCGVCVTFGCDGHRVGACVACGDHDQAGIAAGPAHPALAVCGAAAPVAAAADPGPAVRPIDLALIGGDCGEAHTCSAGLTCLSGGLSGMAPRATCEVACPLGDKQCPTGTTCTTISDGPGRVCRPLSR